MVVGIELVGAARAHVGAVILTREQHCFLRQAPAEVDERLDVLVLVVVGVRAHAVGGVAGEQTGRSGVRVQGQDRHALLREVADHADTGRVEHADDDRRRRGRCLRHETIELHLRGPCGRP